MRRVFANASFDFIGMRRRAYMLSGVLIALGLAFAIFYQVSLGSWVNYGVDFTGGTILQVHVEGDADITRVRSIASAAAPGSVVTEFGGAQEFLIRTPVTGEDAATGPADAVLGALRAEFGADNVRPDRNEAVSAKVGGELQARALLAILVSFGAILVYLAFRFEWRFGVAAVIATGHDILLTLGLISALRLDVSLPTVAAVLTIVGYSLNDKIIVFDRIRENLRAARRPDMIGVLNMSINQTLPRTVLTSGTTLVTLLALYLFGGVIIREFALILIIGIILGTYSSIFIGSPALLEIERRFPREQPTTVKRTQRTPRPSSTRV